jgi:hypothetical protein
LSRNMLLRSTKRKLACLSIGKPSKLGRTIAPLHSASSSAAASVNPLQAMHDSLKCIPDLMSSVSRPEKCPHITKCVERMNEVTLHDVAIDVGDFEGGKFSFCMDIVDSADHDIAIFIVPKGNTLPLHDHPEMTVLSKLLAGSLEVTSFNKAYNGASDNVDEDEDEGRGQGDQLYSINTAVKTSEDPAWMLTPSHGNLHQFRALSTCVILDVLTPPYDEEAGRTCTYYCVKPENEDGEMEGGEKEDGGDDVRWRIQPLPSSYVPDEQELVYNANQHYRGTRVQL